jgi:ATP-dependent protease ClpP protease subunit
MEKEYITKDEFIKIMDNPTQVDQTIETYMKDFEKHKKQLEKEKKKLAKAEKKKKNGSEEDQEHPTPKKDFLSGDQLKKTLDKFLKR